MTAYMIFIREGEIFNQAEMALYSQSNRDNIGAFKLKPLVVYGDLETMEGEAPDGVVVLEFPTMEDARAWYFSPGYQAAAQHRKNGANYRAFLVEGV
ncbi:MAG TPA: DUF1330 domain-containing protein [Halioglobus sp.]